MELPNKLRKLRSAQFNPNLKKTKMIDTNWEIKIDAITQKFEDSFAALTQAQLNYKSIPEGWSITQNIAH